MASSVKYYQCQSHLFQRRLDEQGNSVFDEEDAVQKYITSEIFSRTIPSYVNDNGPFYLCHLDLHTSNVITNSDLKIEAILDWEFAGVLPVEVASAPPRCLTNDNPDDLLPDSESFSLFSSRLQIFVTEVKTWLASSSSPFLHDEFSHYIQDRLNNAFSQRHAFFAWAASDVRYTYPVLWDQIALTTPLLLDKNDTSCDGDGNAQVSEGVIFKSENSLIDAVLANVQRTEVKQWVQQRLAARTKYTSEKDRTKLGGHVDISITDRN
jgi:hypothetical protein